MWKFQLTKAIDLESLLQHQPALARSGGLGQRFASPFTPRALCADARGREMLARVKRGLRRRQNQELGDLLYQAGLIGMMALPASVTQVCWGPLAPDHRLQVARRARRELARGHGPGLVRDVLLGLVAQRARFVADPVLICRAALDCGFHYLAHSLLVVILRMYHRHEEALEALDAVEAQPLSLKQRAMCSSNRGFVLVGVGRLEEAHQAFLFAAQFSSEAHYEINVLLGELMRGEEERAIESAARLELKLPKKGGRTEQALAILVDQMKSPVWEASEQDVQRVNEIKRKLTGIPALIADILSTIPVKLHNQGPPLVPPPGMPTAETPRLGAPSRDEPRDQGGAAGGASAGQAAKFPERPTGSNDGPQLPPEPPIPPVRGKRES